MFGEVMCLEKHNMFLEINLKSLQKDKLYLFWNLRITSFKVNRWLETVENKWKRYLQNE